MGLLIEKEALRVVCSAKGADKIRTAWWQSCMPTEDEPRSPEESAMLARAFLNGPNGGLFQWSHASAQSDLEMATKMIESVRDGIHL